MVSLNKELIKGSFILLVVFNLYSLINFIFQSSMARMLTVAEYGTLGALLYVVYFTNIFSESIQTVVVKFTSEVPEEGKLKFILKKSIKRISTPSIYFFFVYLVLAIPLSFLIRTSYPLIALNGLIIFASLFLPITRGIIQGRKRFLSLGKNLLVEGFVKLIIGLLLVWIGWKVYGAVAAVLLGPLVAFAFSWFALKDVLKATEQPVKTKGIYLYSRPVLITTFSILAFYIADILLAKILFTDEVAGYYAIASMLSKIIFWGTQPISKAMFPISAGLSSKNEKESNNSYLNALALVVICCAGILVVLGFFPHEAIKIFSGKDVQESASILIYLCIATTLLSIANLNILYKISRGQTRNYIFFLLFFIVGIALLVVFHDSIYEFALAFILASAIFLWGSISVLK